jgi:exodeoxyribonuclease V beta subunit
MSQTTNVKLINLDSSTIPLTGRHLIEASAGTGKTYNITRIYLRLLLERELKVEEILLMTFTKDATQELRGRIDSFIRDALANWHHLCKKDNYFKSINERVSSDKIEFLLKRALLFLDEAAIFTIHGFCQRALTQHAFASGLPFNATMSTNSNELVLEAAQDWFRQLSKQNIFGFNLVSQFWATPSSFVSSFAKAISHRSELSVMDVTSLVTSFVQLAKKAAIDLTDNDKLINEGLVTHKKVDEHEKRSAELVKLTSWLSNASECEDESSLLAVIEQPIPDYLLNGNRHPKAFKVQLSEALVNVKEVKNQLKSLKKNIDKAKAYQLVRAAIYQIRAQVKVTKTQLNSLDFDDLINTLADSLQTEDDNPLAQTLLAQYPVALVDEFQDTDPQQFSILHGIYYRGASQNDDSIMHESRGIALYLIGDPKQAIYGFRGGDIFAYLNARSDCDYHWLMDTNWRSSPSMVQAYNQVFLHDNKLDENEVTGELSSTFGYGIPYQAVSAGKQRDQTLNQHSNNHALQFIHFTGEDEKVKQSARSMMATWCANEIVGLLDEQNTNNHIKPQDIAILVRDGREANDIKEALLQANLASVYLSDRANLFHSEQAKQLIQLLEGILSPENERLYLRALACGLLGFNAKSLYELQKDEFAYQRLKFSFFKFREQWQRQGFICMAVNLMHQYFDFTSADIQDNKSRSLTNLLHLFEILQSISQKFLQPQELLYWFEQQCNEEGNNGASELEAEQRLESDGDLIRIVTQHGAKGLEYPVVFIPFATRHKDPLKFGNKSVNYIEYHDEHGQLYLSLDGDEQAKSAMANEAYAESIRLLYVAITRAEHRCYILCTAFEKYALSPLGKTLNWQSEQDISQSLQTLANKAPKAISVQQVSFDDIETGVHSFRKNNAIPHLEVSQFKGKIERDWWLSSFSALSRNLRHAGVSLPDRDSEQLFNTDVNAQNDEALLRFQLTKGAHSGNLLHDILETSNFKSTTEVDNNFLDSIKWPLVKYGELPSGFNDDNLVAWLNEIVTTPLSFNEDCFCLCDIEIRNTLREIEFYYPMENACVSSLEKLLTDHRNIDRDMKYPAIVQLPNYKYLKGMMHGFIDLVFERGGKYYVCDYKSSHLGDDYSHYNKTSLRNNIEKNYYDLQYLKYRLALHRYLKQNLIDYNPEQHFGGIYYLYLRGMSNNKLHTGTGIYFRKISTFELTQLDAVFFGAMSNGNDSKIIVEEINDKTEKEHE